jgi:ubiquinone/menaquinone biosynthesis C-methylase UbiE
MIQRSTVQGMQPPQPVEAGNASYLSDVVAAFYDDIGKPVLSAWVEEYSTGDDIQTALSLSIEGDRILDLACGYGRVALALAQQGYKVNGLDISPGMIASAEVDGNGMKNLSYTVGDMRRLPYASTYFNKVFCFWSSFNHLLTNSDQVACLNEVHRVLKPGGYCLMVLVDQNSQFWKERIPKGSSSGIVDLTYYPNHPPMFIHDDQSLNTLVAQTRFKTASLEVRTMNHSTRLLMHLRK